MMPAMSPTMTEGGVASWKVKEGDKFAAGDVLLEIETDKATMDVEAQEDGIMAKILVNDGAKEVPVGKTIAMLSEEGDDISNVEAPAEKKETPPKVSSEKSASPSSSSSTSSSPSEHKGESMKERPSEGKQAPHTNAPLMPSVSRLLADYNVSAKDAESIKGTGIRGMLTKGDVLAHLGKAQSPTGTYKEDTRGVSAQGGPPAPTGSGGKKESPKSEPLTASSVRSMILSGLASSSHASRSKQMAAAPPSHLLHTKKSAFDELLDDYEFKTASPRSLAAKSSKDPFKGLL
ncbi:hypothetical protein CBS101457_004359 [Exobasidium rhododendri]|nr:hypothetical protein CBS101457_004359 [Exobasidium rhododendri]